MIIKIFFPCLLLVSGNLAWSQPPGTVSATMRAKALEDQQEMNSFEDEYQDRVKKSELYGVYIPEDLGDAFHQLNQLTDTDSRNKFSSMSEQDAGQKLHFSLGRWIISNWGFYQGSRLSKYLNDIGVYEPDDMARFLIITYHRELNNRPLAVKELVAEFQEIRRKEKENRLKEGKVLHEETRKRPVKENE